MAFLSYSNNLSKGFYQKLHFYKKHTAFKDTLNLVDCGCLKSDFVTATTIKDVKKHAIINAKKLNFFFIDEPSKSVFATFCENGLNCIAINQYQINREYMDGLNAHFNSVKDLSEYCIIWASVVASFNQSIYVNPFGDFEQNRPFASLLFEKFSSIVGALYENKKIVSELTSFYAKTTDTDILKIITLGKKFVYSVCLAYYGGQIGLKKAITLLDFSDEADGHRFLTEYEKSVKIAYLRYQTGDLQWL